MLALKIARPALAALLAALVNASAGAESTQGPLVDPGTLVTVGSPRGGDAEVRDGGPIRFRNAAGSPTRLVFSRGDAEALRCATGGDGVTRSRTGQFLLASGATMSCQVAPGRYRYAIHMQHGGRIETRRARLDVR